MFNLDFHNARAALGIAVGGIAALLAAACGDGGDVRIVALTPTPPPEATVAPVEGAVTPPPPTVDDATVEPLPSGVVPDRPADLLTGGLSVASYLAGGSADIAGCLPGLVSSWELAPVLGERCVFADIDGDGASEFAFAVNATTEGVNPGDVWFFQGTDEQFRLFSSARVLANAVLEDVVIEAVADLTGDRFPDLVISGRVCGTADCEGRLLIASAHRGAFGDLAPARLDLSGLHSVRVEDVTGDGLEDVVLRFEYRPDTDAGPRRDRETALNWAGLKFFDTDHPDPPRYLFHAIVDADATFDGGNYEAARAQYEAAAADTALVDWRVEVGLGSGHRELVPYALLRAGLAAQRSGDADGALALFSRAANGFASSLHGQVASIFQAAVERELAPAIACTAAEDYLRPQAARYARIWDYGHANPTHDISDLCR